MASGISVAIAAFLHGFLGLAFYINQNYGKCGKATPLASWIFMVAVMNFLKSVQIYPSRFLILTLYCQIIIETILCTFIMEVAMLTVWCSLEQILRYALTLFMLESGLAQDEDDYLDKEHYILDIVTIGVALAFLLLTLQAQNILTWFEPVVHLNLEGVQNRLQSRRCVRYVVQSLKRN